MQRLSKQIKDQYGTDFTSDCYEPVYRNKQQRHHKI